MSELKAYYVPTRSGNLCHCYIKDEADKVLEEKDYEIKNLKDSINKLLKANTEQIIHEVVQKTLIYGEGFIRVQDAMKLITELRHNKYKRCLNKAEWCEERSARYDALQERTGFSWSREIDFYFRWSQRWLELAEKFKPDN